MTGERSPPPSPDPRRGARLQRAHWIFLAVSLYGAITPFADLLRRHAWDASWPKHARFHVTWAAGMLFALALLTALLARYPLRAGERWSWWALAIVTLFGLGSMVPASIWHQSGPAPHLYVIGVVFLLAMAWALWLAWGPLFRDRP